MLAARSYQNDQSQADLEHTIYENPLECWCVNQNKFFKIMPIPYKIYLHDINKSFTFYLKYRFKDCASSFIVYTIFYSIVVSDEYILPYRNKRCLFTCD